MPNIGIIKDNMYSTALSSNFVNEDDYKNDIDKLKNKIDYNRKLIKDNYKSTDEKINGANFCIANLSHIVDYNAFKQRELDRQIKVLKKKVWINGIKRKR